MAQYKKILAAIGGHEEAGQVWYRARALAAANGSGLGLLHVERRLFGPEVPATPLPGVSPDLIGEAARNNLIEFVDAATGEGVEVFIAAGHPWKLILQTAEQAGADCIVIGSHTPWGIAGRLGSTTDRVVHGADRDVLVVRTDESGKSAAHSGYRRILVPVDFCNTCGRVADHAKQWADRYGAEIQFLHVEEHFPTDRSNEEITPEDQDPAADAEQRSRDRMRQMVSERELEDAPLGYLRSAGAAKHEIVEYARRKGVDLIVIGSHGIHGPGDLLGSTTDGVLHRAPCDVLLIRVRD